MHDERAIQTDGSFPPDLAAAVRTIQEDVNVEEDEVDGDEADEVGDGGSAFHTSFS